jgi:hypothetical protein
LIVEQELIIENGTCTAGDIYPPAHPDARQIKNLERQELGAS